MFSPELRWVPFISLLTREIRRFGKVLIQTIITPIVNSFLYLLIFGVSLGRNIDMGELSYLAFLIPGLVMMSVLNNAFQNSSSSIVSMKFAGDLEDLRVSPLSPHQIIWAMSLGGLARGFIVGTITWSVGQVFYWYIHETWLTIAHPAYLLFFLIMGGIIFAQLGLSVAFWARTVDQLSAVSAFVLLPLLYLGGVFFSIEDLHPVWKQVSQFNPLLYLINGVRYGLLGVSDVSMLQAASVSLTALVLVFAFAWTSLHRGSYHRF